MTVFYCICKADIAAYIHERKSLVCDVTSVRVIFLLHDCRGKLCTIKERNPSPGCSVKPGQRGWVKCSSCVWERWQEC